MTPEQPRCLHMVGHMTTASLASSGSEACSEVLLCTFVAHPYFACLLSELLSCNLSL